MPTKLVLVASTLVSTVAAAPLGCGSLDGHTGTRGTLATVQGGLVALSGYEVHNDVRVAVVWRNLVAAGQGQFAYSVSQDLPVQPVFPSHFVVQLDGPPPAAALSVPRALDVPIALGVVVAYEDLNGNGKLDLVPSDAGAFIDRIVGANENLSLFYIGGPVQSLATQNFVGTPTPGYNLFQTLHCQGCTPPPPEWLPMTTPYDLTVSSDPKLNQIMCQNVDPGVPSSSPRGGAGSSSGGESGSTAGTEAGAPTVPPAWDVGTQGTPPGGYPSPTDPELMCLGPTNYFFQHCVTVDPICGSTMTTCTGIGAVGLGSASRPPDWPCP